MREGKPSITSPAVNATVSAAVGVTVSGTADPGDMVQVRIMSPLDTIRRRPVFDPQNPTAPPTLHEDDRQITDLETIADAQGNWSITFPPPLAVNAVAIRARVLAVNDESPWTTRPITMIP